MVNETNVTNETLYSNSDPNASRGEVKVTTNKSGNLVALIGRRWCRVERRDGRLYEIWVR